MIGLIKPTYVTIKIEGLSKLCKMFGQLEGFFFHSAPKIGHFGCSKLFGQFQNFRHIIKVEKIPILPKILHSGKVLMLEKLWAAISAHCNPW
jgi:hypothetical protein